jgi:hypothetical protein
MRRDSVLKGIFSPWEAEAELRIPGQFGLLSKTLSQSNGFISNLNALPLIF